MLSYVNANVTLEFKRNKLISLLRAYVAFFNLLTHTDRRSFFIFDYLLQNDLKLIKIMPDLIYDNEHFCYRLDYGFFLKNTF